MTLEPKAVLTRKDGERLFLAGVAVGMVCAAVLLWDASRPRRRARVLYFFPDGTTAEAPEPFLQEPAAA